MPDVYNRNSVTKKGYNLLAESIATKKPITFTKVVVGDGDDTGLDINTMTGVVSPKMELPIGNGEKGGDGEYVIQAVLSNKTLEHSFFPKEVGLFAKCGDGEEVLYSYSNGGNNVGLMPDKNTPINAEIYNIRTKIGNATNVTFVTSDDTYVTKGELTKHNTDPDAHGGLLQKVKTELATHNTDILSHPAITAMIAKILGATNWQENPVATLKDIKNLLGMGGIVAQRLEENGFVKFANGFTIQWGYGNQNYEDLTTSKKAYHCKLPISFEHGILFASGQTETNDKVNHYTFVNIAHAPKESTKEEAVFYTWIDWDWSYVQFRLAWMAFGY